MRTPYQQKIHDKKHDLKWEILKQIFTIEGQTINQLKKALQILKNT